MISTHKKVRNKSIKKNHTKRNNKQSNIHNKTKSKSNNKRSTYTRKHNKNTKKNKHKFSIQDYISSDGMLTNVWGPSLWHFLHIISFNYPLEPTYSQKQYYKKFVLSLEYILPCKYCRINFKKNMKSLPLTLSVLKNRYTFSKYIYDLHELINTMLGKKSNLSYDDVRDRYEHFRARCTSKKNNNTNKTYTMNRKFSNSNNNLFNKTRRKTIKKEKGCINPLYGSNKKCIIQIVPKNKKCETFQMNLNEYK